MNVNLDEERGQADPIAFREWDKCGGSDIGTTMKTKTKKNKKKKKIEMRVIIQSTFGALEFIFVRTLCTIYTIFPLCSHANFAYNSDFTVKEKFSVHLSKSMSS